MSRPIVNDFLIDSDNAEKFAMHGLTFRQVQQVLDDQIYVGRNKRGQRTPVVVIGRDHGGLCITIPVEPTLEEDVWRPVTAWPCSKNEEDRLEKIGG